MSVQIISAMFIAAAIPTVTGGGWTYFALAYAANRALTGALYWRARHDDSSGLAFEQGRNFMALAVVFAISAFLPKPMAYWLFRASLLAIQLQYSLPRIGTLRFERFLPRLGHLSERFALIMLILLGEGFFKLVVTLADKGIYKPGGGALLNMAIGGLSLFAMAWIYFDSVGNAKPRSRARPVLLAYWLGHLVLMWATVMVGVALAGEIYVGFLEPYPLEYGLLGTAGLTIWLAAVWLLQRLIAGRDFTARHAHSRVRMFGIAIALVDMAVFTHVPAIIGNTLFGIALFSQILWPLATALREVRGRA